MGSFERQVHPDERSWGERESRKGKRTDPDRGPADARGSLLKSFWQQNLKQKNAEWQRRYHSGREASETAPGIDVMGNTTERRGSATEEGKRRLLKARA